jgi:hypothetical protein
MRRTTSKIYVMVLMVAVAAIVALCPRSARACGGGGNGGALAAGLVVLAGVGAADVVFTGYDLGVAVQDERASNGWATAEVAVAAPQLVIGGLAIANMKWDKDLIAPGFYVLWMGTLTAHGIVTLATSPPRDPRAPRGPEDSPSTPAKPIENEHVHLGMISPTLLNDGASRTLVPGVSATGTF